MGDATHRATVTAEPLVGTPKTEAVALAAQLPVAVGQPIEITSSGPVGPAGVTITRRYNHPLPAGAAATLAYFDPTWQTWVAVPSTLSPDRTSVSATVHHLSLWDDFVSGTTQVVTNAATSAADWAYYQVGKVFDTRVDAPTCTSPRPTWVKDVITIQANRNNPILFCTGQDPKDATTVVVKARVNRGFGFTWTSPTTSVWTWNSGNDPSARQDILNALSGLDAIFAASGRAVVAGNQFVNAGEEIDVGFSETQGRSAGTNPVLELTPQDTLGFLTGTLGSLVGTDLMTKAEGPVVAAIVLAKCAVDLRGAKTAGGAAKAAISCLSTVDEGVARQLGLYLLKRGRANPGQLAGKIVGRATMVLAVTGPLFDGLNYWAERTGSRYARTVTLVPTTQVATPVPVQEYGRHDFNLKLRKDGTATILNWGCSGWLPNDSCSQMADGTWAVVGSKLRVTVTRAYYVPNDGSGAQSPIPDSYWKQTSPRVWGNVGDYLDLWRNSVPGTVMVGGGYKGESTYSSIPPIELCDTTPKGVAASYSGICGA
ncbi:hypothetical protein [Terrabacter sp. 2YAF2]|uniref:hypothetical protein n=1 Tax=Terrabacter sp. 2YAF2 TaxID=3233026 RepID=UPI003F9E0BDB